MSDQRLYGTPGAEVMYLDLASCYESDIDPWYDEPENAPKIIEEWTCAPVASHLPDADWIIANLSDWVGDEGFLDEYGHDNLVKACQGADVKAAAENLRTVIASKITYRMADKLVAEHTITWNAFNEPLVDGEPLYVTAPTPDEAPS